jgi:hypothetical protein
MMNNKTLRFIKECYDVGYSRIGVYCRDKSIPHSLNFPDHFDQVSVYAHPNVRTGGFPAIWSICDKFDIGGGCGNHQQKQIKQNSWLSPGVHHIKRDLPSSFPDWLLSRQALRRRMPAAERPYFTRNVYFAQEVLSTLENIDDFVKWINPDLVFGLDGKKFIKMLLDGENFYVLNRDGYFLCRFTGKLKTVVSFL